MAQTVVGVGDPKAIKKYSAILASDVGRESYFNKKMMGEGERAQTPLQTLRHLENDAGDQISYDLVLQLRGRPTSGDAILRGNEEDLKFFTDSLYIDQQRHGVNTGGKMSRKRTIHDMREIARVKQSEYWARLFDETIFMYLSGARGTNADFIETTSFTGYAGNAFVAPDNLHILYGGDATTKATIASDDKMSLALIDRTVARAKTMGRGSTGVPAIQPVKIDGEEHYVIVMHPFQEYDLRAASGSTWIDIQKAAAAAEGRNNPLFKGGLGMYNNVILHEHQSVITFNDYGAGLNLNAARALFMGRQAGVVAFGSTGSGLRFDWNEEMEDRGNQLVVTTGTIFGIKKTAFTIDGTSRDFGVIALDTYLDDPNT
jgi:N4-gp56 family major capsid protein